MMVTNCPRCNESFRVPAGQLPDDAYAECPWCLESFPVVELLDRMPPVVNLISADGQPINPSLQVASAGAYEPIEPRSSGLEPLEDEPYPDHTAAAPTFQESGDNPWSQSSDSEYDDDDSFQMRDAPEPIAPMRVSPMPTARRKKSGMGGMIGVIIGGVAALPLAGLVLWGIGFLGFGPFAKAPEAPQRQAAAPVDLSPSPPSQGQSMSLSDDSLQMPGPDPADAAIAEIMERPLDDGSTAAANDPVTIGVERMEADPIAAEPDLAEPDLAEPYLAEPDLAVPDLTDPIPPEPDVIDPTVSDPRDRDPILSNPLDSVPGDRDPIIANDFDSDPGDSLVLPSVNPPGADNNPPGFVMPDQEDPAPPSEVVVDEQPSNIIMQPDDSVSSAAADPAAAPPAASAFDAPSQPDLPSGLDLSTPNDSNLSPEPAPSSPTESAEIIATADKAGKMLDAFAPYVGPQELRTQRLLLTYQQIATTCGLAAKDSQVIRQLADQIKSSPIRGEIESIAGEWLIYGGRKTDGIVLIGKPNANEQAPSITLDSGKTIAIETESPLPSTPKAVVMGKIVADGSAVELVYLEPLP